MSRRGADGADLDARLASLASAAALADGRLEPDAVAAALAVVDRAGERLGLSPDRTVVALAGATGSGKSSLFNALAGDDLSRVGVRRPTTGDVTAAVWGGSDAAGVLDWLGVRRRHERPAGDGRLDGLVLLDLPDHDSTVAAHREVVDRLVERADLLVWVLDPQKYADAAVHERYLRPLAGHAAVVLVVLNHADRLDPREEAACLADLRRLLADDGLGAVTVLATSARTGQGLDRLLAELAERVRRRRAALERLTADVADAAARLSTACPDGTGGGGAAKLPAARVEAVVDALAGAAGVDEVAAAVRRSHQREAAGATGWPFTRWVRRFRPDPLRRLGLGAGAALADRATTGPAGAVQRAGVDLATRDLAAHLSSGLPDPWPALLRRAAAGSAGDLSTALDRAVAGTALSPPRRPRWWTAAGVVQRLLAAAAVAGLVWLVVLFALEWLRVPDPPLPRLGELPVPTVLLIGGALLGLLLAGVARRLAAVGARRRARRVRAELRSAVAGVADEHVLAPVRRELAVRDELCREVRRAAGR